MDEQTPNTPTNQATPEPSTPNTPPSGGSKLTYIVVGLVLIGALAAAYFWMNQDAAPAAEQEASAVVAMVNGEEVPRADFTESVDRTNQMASAQGVDVTDPTVVEQIEGQAIEQLVNRTLISQAAKAAEVTISDEEIAAERAKLESQFGGAEALTAQMEQLGVSEEELVADIRQQLTIDAYLESAINTEAMTVSEEEIAAFYDQVAETGQELPPLEEVSAQIEQQLLSQQQQEATQELIDELREAADIEIMI